MLPAFACRVWVTQRGKPPNVTLRQCAGWLTLRQTGSQPSENFRPASLGALCILGKHTLVRQRELAAVLPRNDVDAHAGCLAGVFWNAEGEDQAARPVDVEILTAMLDILSAAPIHKDEPASDPRIDLDTHHLTRRRREQPAAGGFRIEPSVENSFGCGIEAASDSHGGSGVRGHVLDPFLPEEIAASASSERKVASRASS